MLTRDVHIAPQHEGKGRVFRSAVLGLATADSLWDGGQGGGDTLRPCWVVFAGSDQELRPFVANALAGKRVVFTTEGYRRREERLELLKSARYEAAWQRGPEGATCTVFLPDLFRVDPGMVDPERVQFVALPRRAWLDAQELPDADSAVRHVRALLRPKSNKDEVLSLNELRALVPVAHLFAVYIDRRTRCPIYADGRFYLQLLVACLIEGLACFPWPVGHSYVDHGKLGNRSALLGAEGLENLGIGQGLAFKASHEAVERVLAEQTTLFFAKVAA